MIVAGLRGPRVEAKSGEFKAAARRTLADPVLQAALENVYSGFHVKRIQASAATENWDAQRDRGRAIKAHTIANLDYYLDMLTRNVEARGGHVHFATDGREAAREAGPVFVAHGVADDEDFHISQPSR